MHKVLWNGTLNVSYRSMKNFHKNSYVTDTNHVPFHVCNVFDDIDDIFWAQILLFTSAFNEHALRIKSTSTHHRRHMWIPSWAGPMISAMWGTVNSLEKKGAHHLRQIFLNWRNTWLNYGNFPYESISTKEVIHRAVRMIFKTVNPFLSDKNPWKHNNTFGRQTYYFWSLTGPRLNIKTVFPGMGIPMLKIRRPVGRLIFNMGIVIPGKTVFLIETAPRSPISLIYGIPLFLFT